MAFSYTLRLAFLVVACSGIFQILFELLLWIGSPLLFRLLRLLPVRQREFALYLMQAIPFPIALIASLLCSVPQYLHYESNHTPEEIGWGFLALTLSVGVWFCWSTIRGFRVLLKTARFARACRRIGHLHSEVGSSTPILTVVATGHPIALIGLLKPFILVSQDLIARTLSDAGLKLALDHERSHAAHLDNWKLLSLHLLPRLNLRLSNGDTWMQCWQRTAEWAADDEAVGEDSQRALLLAETLVTVVRSSQALSVNLIQSAFACPEEDLITRVELLIHRPPVMPRRRFAGLATLSVLALVTLLTLMDLSSWAPSLQSINEYLLHLG